MKTDDIDLTYLYSLIKYEKYEEYYVKAELKCEKLYLIFKFENVDERDVKYNEILDGMSGGVIGAEKSR